METLETIFFLSITAIMIGLAIRFLYVEGRELLQELWGLGRMIVGITLFIVCTFWLLGAGIIGMLVYIILLPALIAICAGLITGGK